MSSDPPSPDVQAELQRHVSALAKLQGEFTASRLEVAGARGETAQFQGFLGHARAAADAAYAHIEELRIHAANREAEIARLQVEVAALQTELAALRQRIADLLASFSWRMSAPARVTARAAYRLLRRR